MPLTTQTLARPNKTSGFREGLVAVLGIVVVVALMSKVDLGQIEDSGWIHYDKMTTVLTHNWVNGEHKRCTNINLNTNNPFLVCDDAKLAEDVGKMFGVRFYGLTHKPGLPHNARFDWDCKRSDNDDPTFTCKRVPAPPK